MMNGVKQHRINEPQDHKHHKRPKHFECQHQHKAKDTPQRWECVRERDQEPITTSKWPRKQRSIKTLKIKVEEDEKELISSKSKWKKKKSKQGNPNGGLPKTLEIKEKKINLQTLKVYR